MKRREAAPILAVQATHGEHPGRSVAEGALYSADTLVRAIHRSHRRSGPHVMPPMPGHVGCSGPRRGGGCVAAPRSGAFLPDASGQAGRKVADNPTDPAFGCFRPLLRMERNVVRLWSNGAGLFMKLCHNARVAGSPERRERDAHRRVPAWSFAGCFRRGGEPWRRGECPSDEQAGQLATGALRTRLLGLKHA